MHYSPKRQADSLHFNNSVLSNSTQHLVLYMAQVSHALVPKVAQCRLTQPTGPPRTPLYAPLYPARSHKQACGSPMQEKLEASHSQVSLCHISSRRAQRTAKYQASHSTYPTCSNAVSEYAAFRAMLHGAWSLSSCKALQTNVGAQGVAEAQGRRHLHP